MVTIWKRPKSIDFPKVWKIFKGSVEMGGKIPKFWIQDVTENMFDTVIEMMVHAFVNEESSIMEARKYWQNVLEQHLSLLCFAKTDGEAPKIVSVSLNCRTSLHDLQTTFKGNKMPSFYFITQHILQENNFYEEFNVEEVIAGAGSLTRPKYVHQNIGIEMLNCRELLCKATGIKMTFVIVTTDWREVLEKEGFKHYKTVTSEELNKITTMPCMLDGQSINLLYNCYE